MSTENTVNPVANNNQLQWVKPELQVLTINEATLGVATDSTDGTPGTTPAS